MYLVILNQSSSEESLVGLVRKLPFCNHPLIPSLRRRGILSV
jgi:hypothetical protein